MGFVCGLLCIAVFYNAVAVSNSAGTTMDVGMCPLVTGGDCPDPRIKFYLYAANNYNGSEIVDYGEKSSNISQSTFNASQPTKVLIHGYSSGTFIFKSVWSEYMARGDYNIFLMEWSALSDPPCYITAVHNARFAGQCAAELVKRLREIGASDIHLIGFSLGAHVPAFAANHLRSTPIPRITGLDPAMPLFVTPDEDRKLDASDADFVDVIHTNSFMQGKSEQCGHIDFYMNGGVTQPGCFADSGCSHHRAVAYFAESIRSPIGFWGWPCGSIMHYVLGLCPPRGTPRRAGEDVDRRGRGFYVLRTNSEPPFAKGLWQIADSDRARYRGRRSLQSPRVRKDMLKK